MEQIASMLTRKIGPLPAWVYGLAIGAAVVLWRRRQAVAATQAETTDEAGDYGALTSEGDGSYFWPGSTLGGGYSSSVPTVAVDPSPSSPTSPADPVGIIPAPSPTEVYELPGSTVILPRGGLDPIIVPTPNPLPPAVNDSPPPSPSGPIPPANEPGAPQNYCFQWGGKKWGKSFPGWNAFKATLPNPDAWIRSHPGPAACIGAKLSGKKK